MGLRKHPQEIVGAIVRSHQGSTSCKLWNTPFLLLLLTFHHHAPPEGNPKRCSMHFPQEALFDEVALGMHRYAGPVGDQSGQLLRRVLK
eukprot:1146340-Pelagomonas_calceolata.AAC.3